MSTQDKIQDNALGADFWEKQLENVEEAINGLNYVGTVLHALKETLTEKKDQTKLKKYLESLTDMYTIMKVVHQDASKNYHETVNGKD